MIQRPDRARHCVLTATPPTASIPDAEPASPERGSARTNRARAATHLGRAGVAPQDSGLRASAVARKPRSGGARRAIRATRRQPWREPSARCRRDRACHRLCAGSVAVPGYPRHQQVLPAASRSQRRHSSRRASSGCRDGGVRHSETASWIVNRAPEACHQVEAGPGGAVSAAGAVGPPGDVPQVRLVTA